MKLTTLSRAGRTFTSWIGGAALLLIAPLAMAVPPSFTGTITAPMPAAGQTVIINLRQQGVVSGSAPISIATHQGIVLLNGQFSPPSGLSIVPFDPNPSSFGTVCVVIGNVGYSPPAPGTLSAQLSGTNLQSETGGTGLPGITIVDAAGPVVNPNDTAACEDPNLPPVANAGPDRTIVDTNGAPGETVILAGSATDPEGELLTYEWFLGTSETVFATGPTPTVTLPDGPSDLLLRVTDEGGETGTDTVNIVVQPTAGPTANAGADRTITDTDNEDGEDVVLDGSLSTDPDGTITTYRWSEIVDGETEVILGTSAAPTLQVRLADGEHDVRLLITDNSGNQQSDNVSITVGEGAGITTLSDLPNLTPNQRRVAQALDRICGDLRDLSGGEGSSLTGDQEDLLIRCDGLQTGNTTSNQVAALEELVADDFAVARTQTLLFANTQYASVMDRLMALRGGARGLSLAGLNIIVDGKPVPLAQLQDIAKGLLGGGASADEPGGLLSDKWGMWARGNFSFGEKDRNASSPAFDADQWALVGGLDYRFSDKLVGGLALAYGQSSIEFDPRDEGALDTDTWAISVYGSTYAAKNFYFDAIVNIANADYGADRNITYVDGTGLVNVDAHGDTDGMTYSAGLSGGYDFLIGGLTLSPTLGVFYIDATIDSFAESGAGGLNLLYDEQTFQSFTGNVGFRATYAWNLSWGVLLPHVRIDYVREFKDDADVFGVRFAADPNATSTPPILVETDNPDESYWRLATGFSAQFIHGISAYIEYQRLESFEFISFQDVSLGLRLQRSF